jgi:7-cyano-7-deazaguanine synthase in queuosine biosynthesis
MASSVFYLSQKSFVKKQVVYNYPKCLDTKANYIKILGDLIDKVWFCRKPINNIPCGKCHTCVHVEKSLKNILAYENQ